MQYWQRKVEEANAANSLNNVHDILLPSAGLLGSLQIKISGSQATGLGATGGAYRLIDFLTKVEVIVNGSVVVKSFDGYTAQVLSVLDQGVMPPSDIRNYATNTQFEYVMLNFGRYLWDKVYQLDLSKYDNVHLRITNNATVASFTDFTTTVTGFYLKEKSGGLTSPGYLRTEQWRVWTTVADQWQYLRQFPTEYPVRRILLRATPNVDANNIEKTGMHNLMDEIQLYFKTGDITVYDGTLEQLMRDNYYALGRPLIVSGSEYMNAGKGFRIDLGYTLGGALAGGSQSGTGNATIPTAESARSSFTQNPITHEADHPNMFTFNGIAPYETAWFDFDEDGDPADWLDPEAYKDVQINIHTRNLSDAAGGSDMVVLDRLVKY